MSNRSQYHRDPTRRGTRAANGWRPVKNRGAVGWIRASKDQDEIILYTQDVPRDTMAELEGLKFARRSNNNRAAALEFAKRLGSWGGRIFMYGFDSFSKPEYVRQGSLRNE